MDEDFELSEREVIKYMLQIIDGVAFIHKQGIVHLDLKPENIMCINKTGSKIKLIDFGLARRLGNLFKPAVYLKTGQESAKIDNASCHTLITLNNFKHFKTCFPYMHLRASRGETRHACLQI